MTVVPVGPKSLVQLLTLLLLLLLGAGCPADVLRPDPAHPGRSTFDSLLLPAALHNTVVLKPNGFNTFSVSLADTLITHPGLAFFLGGWV